MANVKGETDPYSIVIIGCGPRGISVLERLAALIMEQKKHADNKNSFVIHIIDAYQVGAGRIWRTEQPDCLLMNTLANETTMFSGPPDNREIRPGAGPTLAEWWANVSPDKAEAKELAPRKVYGEYLNYVFNKTIEVLSSVSVVNLIVDSAIDLYRIPGDRWKVVLQSNENVIADQVVLATGHPRLELDYDNQSFKAFSEQCPTAGYIPADSAADMDLDSINPQSKVGIIGCGAAFFDVVSLLTEARGGRFEETMDGGYQYFPSGLEPVILAGSRGGVPFPARSINQKPIDYIYKPYLFTKERMTKLRKTCENAKLNFREDVLPWVEAEVQLIYTATVISKDVNEHCSAEFINKVVERISAATEIDSPKLIVLSVAEEMGFSAIGELDIEKLAHPFHDLNFNSYHEYMEAVKGWISNDITDSLTGNIDSPVKAATDVLRDVRPILQSVVDYGGLTPESHKEDFLGSFVSLCSTLSAGPPIKRLKQVLALIDSGHLSFAGPRVRFSVSEAEGKFKVLSQVGEVSERVVDTLIDARIPAYNLNKNLCPLKKSMLKSGILTSFKNSCGDISFDTGGIAITHAPYNPVSDNGPDSSLYVIGIPAEFTRWFMQVGIARPGPWGQFTKDADAIAKHLLLALEEAVI